jgi:hypothetical protein
MFWVLVLAAVNINGTINLMIHYPTSPNFNTESSCEANGKKISNETQLELGTKNSKVFWTCKAVPYETIAKTLPTN